MVSGTAKSCGSLNSREISSSGKIIIVLGGRSRPLPLLCVGFPTKANNSPALVRSGGLTLATRLGLVDVIVPP